MKAIQKIKNKVIHILGGITEQELVKHQQYSFFQGSYDACFDILLETEQYGKLSEKLSDNSYTSIYAIINREYNYRLEKYKEASIELDKHEEA